MSAISTTIEEMTVSMSEAINALLDHLKITDETKRKEARDVFAKSMGETMGKIAIAKINKELETKP